MKTTAATLAWVAIVIAGSTFAAAGTRVLIVAGLGAEPGYAASFLAQAESAAHHAQEADAAVTLLTAGDSHRAAIRDALASLADAASPADAVVVHLIGHGTYDGETYRFNVPGPDPTAADLAEWLAPVRARRQLIVVATSSSGAVLDALLLDAGLPGIARTVVTATKSGGERNATVFGEYWVAALTDPSADLDKDERISAHEAFRFAQDAVRRHFKARDRMATEHARLEGPEPRFILSRLQPAAAIDPSLDHLAHRRAELEHEIENLRATKANLTIDAYYARLQDLFLELALVERELEEGL